MKAFWRWTGAIFFALAFVFLVMTGIGTSLPIEHRATCSATYEKPIPFLFAAVENDETSVRWRPDIASAVLVSGRGPTAVWRETDIHGNAITYHTEGDGPVWPPAAARLMHNILRKNALAGPHPNTKGRKDLPTAEWQIGDYRSTRVIEFVPGMQFGGTWTILFEPGGIAAGQGPSTSTSVKITEDGEIYNPFFRFLARYVFGYANSMVTYLEDLGLLSHENPKVTCVVLPGGRTSGGPTSVK